MKLLFMLIMAYVHQPKEAKMKLPNQFRNLKVTIVALLVAALTSCSPGGGGSAATALTPPAPAVPPAPLVTPAPWVSYSVATAADLPTCAGDIVSRLYYVESTGSFSVCKSTGWTTVILGNNIISNQIILYSATNYCTQYAGDVCGFNGGQIVKYADGSVLILGMWTSSYATTTPDNDTDVDTYSVSALYPASVTAGYQRLAPLVARGTGPKAVYLVYTRSPESIKVVYDTNGNRIPEATDEILYTPTLSNW